jgi:methionyl-tRNA formyltransferase
MTKLNWAFLGCKEQGLRVLNALAAEGFTPSLIVTLAEIPTAERAAFAQLAQRFGADFTLDSTFDAQKLKQMDVGLVCRFPLLPEAMFSAPRLGCVNIHSSLLPRYRGIHPVQWALVNGEEKTGVTLHQIDKGVDTGPILLQRELAIKQSHDIHSLTEDLNVISAALAVELFQFIAAKNTLPPGVAPRGASSYARRRTPEDSRLDWNWPAVRIFNLVRAMRPPMPPAYCQDAWILSCALAEGRGKPGEVLAAGEGKYLVACGEGAVEVTANVPLKIGGVLA